MEVTSFLVEVLKELLGNRSEDLRGQWIIFEGELSQPERIKELTYFGTIVAFSHRRVMVKWPKEDQEETLELIFSDTQAKLWKSSKSKAWKLSFGGDQYVGTVRME